MRKVYNQVLTLDEVYQSNTILEIDEMHKGTLDDIIEFEQEDWYTQAPSTDCMAVVSAFRDYIVAVAVFNEHDSVYLDCYNVGSSIDENFYNIIIRNLDILKEKFGKNQKK